MIDYFFQNPATFWFLIGFILLAIEVAAFGMASGVLLFVGLGAILTGIVFWMQLVPTSWLLSLATFAVCSALCALILWKPMQLLQNAGALGNDRSSDLIGLEFKLSGAISSDQPSSTKYSGVSWRVELDEESGLSQLAAGERVRVNRVAPGVFYVISAN